MPFPAGVDFGSILIFRNKKRFRYLNEIAFLNDLGSIIAIIYVKYGAITKFVEKCIAENVRIARDGAEIRI